MLKFQNITEKQIKQNGVQALSDRPNSVGAYGSSGLSPLELKVAFDRLAALIAEKVNEIHNILASDEAAEYIAIALHDNDIHDLSRLVAAIKSGALANILELYPTAGSDKRVNLQNAIYDIARLLSDHDHDIKEVLKQPPFAEYDPTVPNWAKQPAKPSYTAAEIGAAPAGFGLGEYYPKKSTGDPAVVDTWRENGWYGYYNSKGVSLIPSTNWGFYGAIRVDAGVYGYRQTFIPRTHPSYSLIRSSADAGAWTEWEWVNPPMYFGVEYRTTERWQGKAVYTKAIDCGALPNAASKSIQILPVVPSNYIGSPIVIMSNGCSFTGSGFDPSTHTSDQISAVTLGAYLYLTTFYDASALSASVIVKYTKD